MKGLVDKKVLVTGGTSGIGQAIAVRFAAESAFVAARAAIRHFLAEHKPGVIINVSSVHQIIPKPRFLGYSVSKGGIQNLTRTLALEYAGRGIRVNTIGPGATITNIEPAPALGDLQVGDLQGC